MRACVCVCLCMHRAGVCTCMCTYVRACVHICVHVHVCVQCGLLHMVVDNQVYFLVYIQTIPTSFQTIPTSFPEPTENRMRMSLQTSRIG